MGITALSVESCADIMNQNNMGFLTEKRCERCGKSEEYVALEKHHPLTRSKGGKKTIYLCTKCHRWVHENIEEAKKLGLYIGNYSIDKK